MNRREMNRREFAQLAAVGVAGVWLPACASPSSGAPPSSQPSSQSAAGGTPITSAGSASPFETQLATGSTLQSFAPDGRMFQASPLDNSVAFLSPSGARIALVGDPSRVPTRALGDVNNPVAAAWDDAGQRLLVLEQGNQRIQAFDATGTSLGVVANGTSGSDLVLHPDDGTIYVASTLAHRIDVFDSIGRSLGTVGRFGTDTAGLNGPGSVAVSSDGTVHVVDMGSALVKVFNSGGEFLRSYGSASGASSQLVGPRSLRFDGSGRAWVADTFGAAVCVYDAQGTLLSRFSPRLSNGEPAAPISLSARADGSIYAALIAAG
jgi:DNA-binding beta-propeller fold protein YncE